ncbi:MAG: hypothetical protein EAZ66_07455, partial [Alphaproteobacteria bacterium]
MAASAQGVFNDDFAGGLALWQNTTDYAIVNGQLKHTATTAGTSYIVAAADMRDSVSWEFFFQLDFSPSSSNFTQITLQSDVQNVSGAFNGYYLKMGETGADLIRLYKKSGTASTLLASASDTLQTTAPVKARVKVTRNAAGQWKLYADYTGGSDFSVVKATATDNTFPRGNFFGIGSTHTVTNAGKLYYDDMRIAP